MHQLNYSLITHTFSSKCMWSDAFSWCLNYHLFHLEKTACYCGKADAHELVPPKVWDLRLNPEWAEHNLKVSKWSRWCFIGFLSCSSHTTRGKWPLNATGCVRALGEGTAASSQPHNIPWTHNMAALWASSNFFFKTPCRTELHVHPLMLLLQIPRPFLS